MCVCVCVCVCVAHMSAQHFGCQLLDYTHNWIFYSGKGLCRTSHTFCLCCWQKNGAPQGHRFFEQHSSSFSQASYLTKTEKPRLPYYLLIAKWEKKWMHAFIKGISIKWNVQPDTGVELRWLIPFLMMIFIMSCSLGVYIYRKWSQWHEFKSWTETDCISHSTNTLGKGMNPIILPPAMGE